MVTCVRPVSEAKATKKATHFVGSECLISRYKAVRETGSIESRVSELEARFRRYIESALRARLRPEDIETLITLSEDSVRNIVTIQRLAKQIQEASDET